MIWVLTVILLLVVFVLVVRHHNIKKQRQMEKIQKEQEAKWKAMEEEILSTPRKRDVWIKKTAPFVPGQEQFVYYEKEYDAKVNALLQENIQEVRKVLSKYKGNISLFYLPERQHSLDEFLSFNYPQFTGQTSMGDNKLSKISISDLLDKYIVIPDAETGEPLGPGFLRVRYSLNFNTPVPVVISQDGEDYYLCEHFDLRPTENYTILSVIEYYARQLKLARDAVFFSSVPHVEHFVSPKKEETEEYLYDDDDIYESSSEESAYKYLITKREDGRSSALEPSTSTYTVNENNFYEEMNRLVDEVRERMTRLRAMGVDELLIKQLLVPKVVLSPIVVTAKRKIFLPAFGNMEVKMEPLPKAVYLLFLRHPEGIIFKDLPDYRDELAELYRSISNRSDKVAIEKSVDELVDSTKNSINEKCARIREAFLKKMSDEVALNYYVDGEWCKPKSVAIAKKDGMVRFE